MVAILFIFSFTALIAVSYFVERRREAVGHAGEEGGRIFVRSLVLPKGLFLSPGHTWTEVLSNGYARVGLDDFVRKLVGSIDRVEVLPVRTTVKRGQPLCSLHQANRNLTIRAPVSGTIVSVNPQHENPPSGLTADAYFGGWLAVVEPSDLASDIKVMRIAEEAKGWLNQELRRFREFVEESVRPTTMQPELSVAGTTLLDGGAPAAGLLGRVGPETWRAFEERFLSPEDTALLAP